MCGIVGYIGTAEKKQTIINALKELEYRGYDSAGLSVLDNENHLHTFKAAGKISELESECERFFSSGAGVAIGHTRWATHGEPTSINSHPHNGAYSSVIHNGIIENFEEIKASLEGVKFASQTDTEAIVHLFEREYHSLALASDFAGASQKSASMNSDVQSVADFCSQPTNSPSNSATNGTNLDIAKAAFAATIKKLRGAFAILLISQKAPGVVFFAANCAPLSVAVNELGEVYFASCDAPLVGICKEVSYLNDGDYGYADASGVHFIKGSYLASALNCSVQSAAKDGFASFMQKEIYEQHEVAASVLLGRLNNDAVGFSELSGLKDFSDILICACGTSFHAALAASYLFEREAHIPCRVEIASEFRYKQGFLNPKTLFICLSQSGETADTLEALKIAKAANLATLALVNVQNSSIARLADRFILLRAGIEKSVASTKAFCAQMLTLWLLSLELNRNPNRALNGELAAIKELPQTLRVDAKTHNKIKRLSKRYLHGHGFFFIGRDVFYPLALEAALKLKEISYLHAEGYAAGEMKHGPIALADAELFTMAFMPRNMLAAKTASNVLELAARDATILAIGPDEFEHADDHIRTHEHDFYMSEFFEMMVVMQLFALEIATRLGLDVDMPRNLAKSVTVE